MVGSGVLADMLVVVVVESWLLAGMLVQVVVVSGVWAENLIQVGVVPGIWTVMLSEVVIAFELGNSVLAEGEPLHWTLVEVAGVGALVVVIVDAADGAGGLEKAV